ncbi:MAG: hypothetical protein LWW81_09020 [Rhodocyclales bacterium]|nr:hypothetical protein [Rhodocyclales bacterium]
MRAVLAIALALVAGQALAAELDRTPIDALTVNGEKVRLFPNGRWEYADAAKAAAAQQKAAEYPENQTRPVEAQGGLFGVGRVLMPGDKDYNRGSLNPKLR